MSRYDRSSPLPVEVDPGDGSKPSAVALAVLMMTAIVVLVPVVTKVASSSRSAPFSPVFSETTTGPSPSSATPTRRASRYDGNGTLCDTARQRASTSDPVQKRLKHTTEQHLAHDVGQRRLDQRQFNSSSTTVTVASGSTVLFAGLFSKGRECAYAAAAVLLPTGELNAPAEPPLSPFDQMKLEGPEPQLSDHHGGTRF